MKQLFFIRHAKSSWSDPTLPDFERPLNQRGLKDAPKMAIWLSTHFTLGRVALISSPAIRAFTTAEYFADQLKVECNQIRTVELLYHGTPSDYITCLNPIDRDIESVLVFGHNPMLDEISSHISSNMLPHMPTCSILSCTVQSDKWSDISLRDIQLLHLTTPKSL